MGLCRYALDVAVLAVNVEVEASRFQAGVDDISMVSKKSVFPLPRDLCTMKPSSHKRRSQEEVILPLLRYSNTPKMIRGGRVQNQIICLRQWQRNIIISAYTRDSVTVTCDQHSDSESQAFAD